MFNLLYGASRVNFAFYLQVRLMRFFWCIKPSDKCLHAVSANARAPSFATFYLRHAKKPACFVARMRAALILYITGSRYVSKVIKSIILRVSVNVVDVVFRPFAGHVKPSKPAGAVSPFVHGHNTVPVGACVANNNTGHNFSACFYPPHKKTGVWAVRQDALQFIK